MISFLFFKKIKKMNDHTNLSKFLIEISTSDGIPVYGSYYELKVNSSKIENMGPDELIQTDKSYVLKSQFSSQVWNIMLNLMEDDHRGSDENFTAVLKTGVKFRELIDFIEYYELHRSVYRQIFGSFLEQRKRVREAANKLDTKEVRDKLSENGYDIYESKNWDYIKGMCKEFES